MDDRKLAAELFSIRVVVAINAATIASLVTRTAQAEFVSDQRKLALDAVTNANITGDLEDIRLFKENCRSSLASIYDGIDFPNSTPDAAQAIATADVYTEG